MRSVAIVGVLATVAVAGAGADLARAQKKGDVVAVQELLRDIERAGRDASRSEGAEGARLHALMMQLDPKRAGGFVSAPCLARGLLLRATATGDTKYVPDAAKVIRAHAKQRGAGQCAKAMVLYADGMEALSAKDDGKGARLLENAFAIARDEGWAPLALHLAVEIATVRVRQRDPEGAAAAIATLEAVLPAGSDFSSSYILRDLYAARLNDAPAGVKAAFDKVMALHTGSRSVSSAGGAGGKGGAGGGAAALSKVGAALRKFGKRKPLMTVWRTDAGFEIRQGFDKSFAADQPRKDGTHYHADGGVTLGFWGAAVGLYMIDPEGRRGQPGESSVGPSTLRAYYFLGRKEKWSVSKQGVVSIQ